MQGWRKRQEDAHISAVSQGDKKDIDVFGVFDGHGGKEISKFVSNHFTEELKNNKNLYTDMSLALKETFIKMDEIMQTTESIEEIKKYARMSKEEDEIQSKNEPPNSQMQLISQLIGPKDPESNDISMRTGCTACVMSIDETNKKLYFANAGDSRVVMCKKGIAEAMSEDHKPEMESEKNRIYKADGWISDGRVKGNLNKGKNTKENTLLNSEKSMDQTEKKKNEIPILDLLKCPTCKKICLMNINKDKLLFSFECTNNHNNKNNPNKKFKKCR